MDQDILLELYNAIPEGVNCEANPEMQQRILQACFTYNKLITEKVECSTCKWNGAIRPAITKYLKGIGKL